MWWLKKGSASAFGQARWRRRLVSLVKASGDMRSSVYASVAFRNDTSGEADQIARSPWRCLELSCSPFISKSAALCRVTPSRMGRYFRLTDELRTFALSHRLGPVEEMLCLRIVVLCHSHGTSFSLLSPPFVLPQDSYLHSFAHTEILASLREVRNLFYVVKP